MSIKPTLLSTKKLQKTHRELLADYRVEEVPFIDIELNKNIAINERVDFAVFTSQNAVRAVFEASKVSTDIFERVYCVGTKTSALLQSFGVQITQSCNNAEELALCIVREKNIKRVHFFCGNLRRNELPELLTENGISVKETEVYTTKYISEKLTSAFHGILFFSPSAVQSYIAAGNSNESTAFCIGNTTAVEAIMEFENVYVAEEPTIEAVIELVKANLK